MNEHEFAVSGAMVVFKLEPTPYQAFKNALDSEGWGWAGPNPRTDHSALVNAVSSVNGGRDKKVIPRKKSRVNGVELVEIEKDTVHNSYTTSFGAKVVNGAVKTDYGYASEFKLTEEFLKSKAVLTTTAMSNALRDIIARLHGQTGFCRPGIYYIPESSLPQWFALVRRIEGISPASVLQSYRAAMDENTAKAVKDALTAEVQEEATQLLEDVTKGTLSDAQLHVRAERAQALVAKVDLYAGILNDALTGLKNVAQVANGAAAAAIMQDFAGAGVAVGVA